MAGITLTQAQAQLDAWLAASLAVAQKQSYRIADRQLTYADAAEVAKNIDHWQRQVTLLTHRSAGRGRARTIIFKD
jgi:outer membrane PBP1 activator LpoA protein